MERGRLSSEVLADCQASVAVGHVYYGHKGNVVKSKWRNVVCQVGLAHTGLDQSGRKYLSQSKKTTVTRPTAVAMCRVMARGKYW